MVDGMDVREYKITDLRDKIGIVPQKAVLFAGTVRSNLAWGKEDATEEEMQQALSVAQAAEVVDKKDGKLDAEVEQGGKNFSGGQKAASYNCQSTGKTAGNPYHGRQLICTGLCYRC